MQAPVDLSQLKDIHLPNAVHDWPIAFGWWLILIASLLTLAAGIYLWRRYKAKHANKKAALKLLAQQYAEFKANQDGQLFLQQSTQTLKRYCLQQYPQAVSYSGTAWTDFLMRHSNKVLFSEKLITAMSQGIYQQQCQFDEDELYKACTNWLKNNKPVSEHTALNASKGHSND